MHAVLSGGLRHLAAQFFVAGGSSKSVLDREIADGHVWLTSRRSNSIISMSSISPEGRRTGRPGRISVPSNKSTMKPNKPKEKSGGGSSRSDQGEIIALFKRIQSSITEGADAGKKRRSRSLREKEPAVSVTKEARKHLTENQEREPDVNQAAPSTRNPLEKKQETQTNEQSMMSRPVSNFIKRSPIPSMASAKEETDSTTVRNSSLIVPKQLKSQKLDEWKLPELKELAKSKGIKGYSKLKKRELVELLKGLAQP